MTAAGVARSSRAKPAALSPTKGKKAYRTSTVASRTPNKNRLQSRKAAPEGARFTNIYFSHSSSSHQSAVKDQQVAPRLEANAFLKTLKAVEDGEASQRGRFSRGSDFEAVQPVLPHGSPRTQNCFAASLLLQPKAGDEKRREKCTKVEAVSLKRAVDGNFVFAFPVVTEKNMLQRVSSLSRSGAPAATPFPDCFCELHLAKCQRFLLSGNVLFSSCGAPTCSIRGAPCWRGKRSRQKSLRLAALFRGRNIGGRGGERMFEIQGRVKLVEIPMSRVRRVSREVRWGDFVDKLVRRPRRSRSDCTCHPEEQPTPPK